MHYHPLQRTGVAAAQGKRDLRLTELIKSVGRDIVPPNVFLLQVPSPMQFARVLINAQMMKTQKGWNAYPVWTTSWAEAGDRRRENGRMTYPDRPHGTKAGEPGITAARRAVIMPSLAEYFHQGPGPCLHHHASWRAGADEQPWRCIRMKHALSCRGERVRRPCPCR
jgi:hypothetical protein